MRLRFAALRRIPHVERKTITTMPSRLPVRLLKAGFWIGTIWLLTKSSYEVSQLIHLAAM